jgi:outer membrane lipoprotein-sorting protein
MKHSVLVLIIRNQVELKMTKNIFATMLLVSILISCKKDAGDGGNSSINGKVNKDIRAVLTNAATLQRTVPAADQEVYIVYGEHVSPDDKVQTNYDGEFEFLYLRPGKYKVYTFSKDTNSVAVTWDERHMVILDEVEIADKKQDVKMDDMTIYDTE